MTVDALSETVTVAAEADRAYGTFVDGFAAWWPAEYTFAQADLDRIFIEARVGGRCVERNRAGEETVWGTVLTVEPSERLILAWQITPDRRIEPDPEKAGLVDIRFVTDGNGRTRVDLTHHHFARYGDGWQDYLAGMASPQGWRYCLDKYAAAFA